MSHNDNYYAIVTFITGVLIHAVVFSNYEWDRRAIIIFSTFFASYLVLVVVFVSLGGLSWTTFAVASAYSAFLLGGLFSSMTVYRTILHPLKSFPGPVAARVTSLWILKENIPNLNFYIKMRTLHNQYGDFVRIRPREISICHPDAIVDVHGPRTKVRKGEFYDQTYPLHTLQFIRDHSLHREQRKHWDRAFQTTALQGYIPRLTMHYAIVMSIFSKHAASRNPIDASGTFLDLFFDVISDLTFGKSFDNLTTKQRSPIVADFLKGHKALGYFLLNMPILQFARGLRKLRNSKRDREMWYHAALDARSKMQTNTSDIYTYLSQSTGFQSNTLSEAKLAVVAGADTNAITVSNVCFLLCRYPEIQGKLYSELSDLPSPGGIIDDQYLFSNPYLIGIINETLRLYPPVPSGLQRLTPPQGAMIAGRYIPGNMNVTTPTYSLQRDPRAFVHPNNFIPERWSTQPELILRKDAFAPFGYGAYSCAGKPLAMLQLRMVVAMVFKRFKLSFAPGKEEACCDFIENQAECFTLHLQPLPLVLEERRST